MTILYDAKVIRFENHIEIIRYGESRIRVSEEGNYFKKKVPDTDDINEEEKKKLRLLQQAFRIKRKIKYYCVANEFDLFWTLTFDDRKVNAKNYEYSRKQLQAWLKYQREKYGKFDYLFIPELHKSGRIHFHSVTGRFSPLLKEARYPKSNRLIKKKGVQIYNAENWNKGFSTVSKIQSREKSSSYITKYITKELLENPSAYHQPRYFVSRGLKKPEISFEKLSDDYFSNFSPSFVIGTKNLCTNEFEAEISIYQIDVNEDGEIYQKNPPETTWKSRNVKSSDGNQSS